MVATVRSADAHLRTPISADDAVAQVRGAGGRRSGTTVDVDDDRPRARAGRRSRAATRRSTLTVDPGAGRAGVIRGCGTWVPVASRAAQPAPLARRARRRPGPRPGRRRGGRGARRRGRGRNCPVAIDDGRARPVEHRPAVDPDARAESAGEPPERVGRRADDDHVARRRAAVVDGDASRSSGTSIAERVDRSVAGRGRPRRRDRTSASGRNRIERAAASGRPRGGEVGVAAARPRGRRGPTSAGPTARPA